MSKNSRRKAADLQSIGYRTVEVLEGQYVIVECSKCGSNFKANKSKLGLGVTECACIRLARKERKYAERLKLVRELAATNGGELITPFICADSKFKYTWKCRNGHTWKAILSSVRGQGTWCPVCAGNSQRSIHELKVIVESRGGKLISTEYHGVDALYDYECNLGHQNSNQFKKIETGQWCAVCNKNSKSEEITRAILENLFEAKFPKKRPNWLRNSRGRLMELDGYCEELGIAFEFQGRQHFQKLTHFAGDLEQRIEDDRSKVELCEASGVRLLIFTYLDKFESFHEIARSQLETAGAYGIANFSKPVNFAKAYIRVDRLEELAKLLDAKSIDVLSTKWLKVDTFYEFQCRVCGSKWKSRANAYFNSRRVAGCDFCQRRVPGNMKDLAFLKSWAKEHGGEALTDSYVGRKAKYRFMCSKGHEFESNLNNMMHRNQFCPVCENIIKRREFPTLEEIKVELRQKNLLILNSPARFRDVAETKCLICGSQESKQIRTVLSSAIGCKRCKVDGSTGFTRGANAGHSSFHTDERTG